jgi:putative FmdB family regulatory protein
MPLYEYECESCGGRFERIRKFSDPPLEEPCPTCGGPIRKLISSPAIQFKGKGWYVTDYAKSGATEPSKSESSKSEASADAKSDAKKKESASESKSESTSSSTESKSETKTEAPKAPVTPAKSS